MTGMIRNDKRRLGMTGMARDDQARVTWDDYE